MADLSINNIINVSVSEDLVGLGEFNPSNIVLFTHETAGVSFGSDPYKIYFDSSTVSDDFGFNTVTARMAGSIFSQQPNILANRGYLVVIPLEANETIGEAVTRTEDLVEYFAVLSTRMIDQDEAIAAASPVISAGMIFGLVSRTATDLDTGGYFDTIKNRSFNRIRTLYYGADNDDDALMMLAAYFGRNLSTNFDAVDSTSTPHLKRLIGISPDPSITQSLLTRAIGVGADTYISIQGRPGIYSSGENDFFDDVYNLSWFRNTIQIAGFNYLAGTSNKIPQTEGGFEGFKSAFRDVCERAVSNGFLAPGEWTAPVTFFGNQEDFLNAIRQRGYYIGSESLAVQTTVSRENRESPVVRIAIKYAGAIHGADIIINVNK